MKNLAPTTQITPPEVQPILSSTARGTLCAVTAFFLWGILPVYWKALKSVQASEVLAHRIVWSALFLLVILAWQGRLWIVVGSLRIKKNLKMLSLTTVIVGTNWLTYIWAIQQDRALETSLGYFVSPLVTVGLGVFVLKEKLSRLQWIALAIAALSALYYTLSIGVFPWVALTLAATFSTYGYLKKHVSMDSIASVAIETFLLTPIALFYLYQLNAYRNISFLHGAFSQDVLLIGTGIITAIPLLFFGQAAQLLPLSSLGFLQYLGPTLQFLIAVFIFKEPFGVPQFVTFSGVLLAIVAYTYDRMRTYKRIAIA